MSVFPLNIPEKTNTPALLAFFQQFGLDKYLSAEEINKITEALTELKEASANVSIVNTIFVNNGFEKVDQLFTAFANSEWNINGINYTNPTDQVITIPLCATGKVRTDRIVLDTNNNFVRVPGVEVDENPVAEAKPVNTLDYTFIPVNDAEVGDPSSPVIGNIYQQKQFDYLQTYTGTGTDVVIPLNTTGRSHIQLKGTMTSVAGLSFADLVANPVNAEYPHYGKRFLFFNDSGHDIVLKHLVGTEDIFFTFKEETDLVFPNGEFLEFFNSSNVFINVFRSWKDISNKLDKVSTVDVEKVYVKNADGTQGMKPVSELGVNKRTVCFTYEFNGALNTATNNWWGAVGNGTPSILVNNAAFTPSNNFSFAQVQSPSWVVPFNCRLKSIIFKGFSNTGAGVVDLAFTSGTYLGSGSTLVNNTILSNQPFTLHNYLGVSNGSDSLYVFDTGFTNYVIPKGYEIRMFMNNRNVAKNLLSTTIIIEFEEEI